MVTLDDLDIKLLDTKEKLAQLTALLKTSADQQAKALRRLENITSGLERAVQGIRVKTDKLPKEFVRSGATYRIR